MIPRHTRPLVKICGLTRQEDLRLVDLLGFDFAGFIFFSGSPRHVTVEQAAGLQSNRVQRVGVFVDTPPADIPDIMAKARLDFAQMHGPYTPGDCQRIGMDKIIKVFWPERYADTETFMRDMDAYADAAAAFLLDAGMQGGGSGKSLSWKHLEKIVPPRPFLLAGGLSPQTIQASWEQRSPRMAGLDINSGIEERPGCKNREQLRELSLLLKTDLL